MAEYKVIKGRRVQSLASDLPTAYVGQVWYNTTTEAYKSVVGAAAWATGGNMVTPSAGSMGGAGTQTSAVVMATGASPSTSYEYDGASWTTSPGTLNTGRTIGSGGGASNTAAIYCGGYSGPPAYSSLTAVEEYNGSTWSSNPTSLNTARKGQGGAGLTTEAVWVAGGVTHPPSPGTNLSSAETFNGSTWTTSPGAMNTGRQYMAAAGSSTAAVVAGGQVPPPYATYDVTELFDGSAWTTANTLNQTRKFPRGNGTQTAAAAYGGNSAPPTSIYNDTELWDGTSWATSVSMSTPRDQFGSAVTATQMTALACGGETPSSTDATEELGMVDTVKTITTS